VYEVVWAGMVRFMAASSRYACTTTGRGRTSLPGGWEAGLPRPGHSPGTAM
jgi:hypothetical protein